MTIKVKDFQENIKINNNELIGTVKYLSPEKISLIKEEAGIITDEGRIFLFEVEIPEKFKNDNIYALRYYSSDRELSFNKDDEITERIKLSSLQMLLSKIFNLDNHMASLILGSVDIWKVKNKNYIPIEFIPPSNTSEDEIEADLAVACLVYCIPKDFINIITRGGEPTEDEQQYIYDNMSDIAKNRCLPFIASAENIDLDPYPIIVGQVEDEYNNELVVDNEGDLTGVITAPENSAGIGGWSISVHIESHDPILNIRGYYSTIVPKGTKPFTNREDLLNPPNILENIDNTYHVPIYDNSNEEESLNAVDTTGESLLKNYLGNQEMILRIFGVYDNNKIVCKDFGLSKLYLGWRSDAR